MPKMCASALDGLQALKGTEKGKDKDGWMGKESWQHNDLYGPFCNNMSRVAEQLITETC